MLKRTAWIALVALLVVGLVLAACTPETIVETVEVEVTVPGTGETETVVVTATPEPVEPTTYESEDPNSLYYVASSEGIDTLDPAWNYESEGDSAIRNIYDQLVTYDGTSAISFIPSLADEWEISEDGMTYTFHIREGVTFHNGNDLTPADVAYTFRRGILQGGTWSPQWLFTEPLFGTGVYDIAEVVADLAGLDDIYSLEDDPEALAGADPEAVMSACEMLMDAIEYDDAAGRASKISAEALSRILGFLCATAHRQKIFFLWRPYLPDPKDEMVLELAVAAQASHIVTYNQRDFRGAERFGVRIVKPEDFLDALED